MRITIGFLVLSLFLGVFSCSPLSGARKGLRAIRVDYHLPVPYPDGTVFNGEKTYYVFYYKDLIMYESFYRFDSTYNGVSLLREMRNAFFVYHKDSTFGRSYDGKRGLSSERALVTETVRRISINDNSLDTIVFMQPDSVYRSGRKTMMEVYKVVNPENQAHNCVLYLKYDKDMMNVRESFSPGLDSFKKTKLVGVDIAFEEAYSAAEKMRFPKRTVSYSMKPLSFTRTDNRFLYFEHYEKDL